MFIKGCFPGGSEVKASACSVGQEDPLEKEIAIHSSILAWGIPWCATVHGVEKSRTQLNDFTSLTLSVYGENTYVVL